jgi:hypothetical protein
MTNVYGENEKGDIETTDNQNDTSMLNFSEPWGWRIRQFYNSNVRKPSF